MKKIPKKQDPHFVYATDWPSGRPLNINAPESTSSTDIEIGADGPPETSLQITVTHNGILEVVSPADAKYNPSGRFFMRMGVKVGVNDIGLRANSSSSPSDTWELTGGEGDVDPIQIPLSKPPFRIVPSADGTRVYVSGYLDELTDITTIDATTNKVIANLPGTVRYSSSLFAVSPDDRRLYLPKYDGALVVHDANTHQVLGTVNNNNVPYSLALSPDGNTAWVRRFDGLCVVDTVRFQVIRTIPFDGNGIGETLSSRDGARVYTSTKSGVGSQGGTVTVFDTLTSSVNRHIEVGIAAYIALSPDGTRLYVAQSSQQLLVIETRTFTVTHSIPLGAPNGYLSISPDGKSLVCASTAKGLVIDTDNLTVRTFSAGDPFWDSAFSPNGKRLYMSMRLRKEVSVIPSP